MSCWTLQQLRLLLSASRSWRLLIVWSLQLQITARLVPYILRNPHIHKLVNTYVLDKNLESERNIKILLVPVISNFQMALSTSSRASGVGGGGGESPCQSRGDHIDITYQQTRSPSTMTAHITDISQLSPTIKGFRYVSLARYVVHGHNLWLVNCDNSQHRVWNYPRPRFLEF